MPLYEYQCSECAHRFERIVKFSDPPLSTCPECGKDAVEQMISAPAVQFKGSGWYVTDYAKKGSSISSAPAKSADTGTGNGDSAKSSSTESSLPAPSTGSSNPPPAS